MDKTPESPIVDEVRGRAEAVSARYGHDLKKYAEHLKAIERERGTSTAPKPRPESGQTDKAA